MLDTMQCAVCAYGDICVILAHKKYAMMKKKKRRNEA